MMLTVNLNFIILNLMMPLVNLNFMILNILSYY